jgi:hypothetical protein
VTYAAGGALVTSGGDIEIPRGKIATAMRGVITVGASKCLSASGL